MKIILYIIAGFAGSMMAFLADITSQPKKLGFYVAYLVLIASVYIIGMMEKDQ